MPHNVLNNINLGIVEALASKTATGTGTPIDVSGRYSVAFLIYFTAISAGDTSNYFTFEIVEDDVSPFTAAAAVADANRIIRPTGTFQTYYPITQTDYASASECFRSDKLAGAPAAVLIEATVGIKRYMSVKWTETGTASQTFGIIALANYTRRKPTV